MSVGTWPVGSAAVGTGFVAGVAAGVPTLGEKALEIFVSGTNWTPLLNQTSWSIESEIAARAKLSCELRWTGSGQAPHFQIGEQVRAVYRGALVFGGFVEETTERIIPGTSILFTSISCVDFNALPDRHRVQQKYAVVGQTLFDVVTLIVTQDSGIIGERLSDEGVLITGGSVQTGPTLGTIVFDDIPVKEAFDQLGDLTGFWWWLDNDKVLHFVDRQTIKAPYALDESQFTDFTDVVVKKKRGPYRNIQRVRGGRDITDAFVENLGKGDGEKRTFTLSLEVAETPTILINGSPVAAADVGIRQKDENKKWYYAIDDKEISQDSGETPLSASQVLTVNYKGFFPITVESRNDAEISSQKAIGGGTGTDTDVETDTSINDSDLAEEKVSALIRRYSRILPEIDWLSYTFGCQVGQLIDVNLPEHLLSGDALITRMSFGFVAYDTDDGTPDRPELYGYKLTGVSGEFLGGWADFFRRLASKGRPFVRNENQKLHHLREIFETVELSDFFAFDQPLGSFVNDIHRAVVDGAGGRVGDTRLVALGGVPGHAWGSMIELDGSEAVS